ncbi:hypothetical protein EDD86DRAFT_209484 [Gorgonomyces haynaldii]|nr:hypothetical protein EDD86DRAFT_209484 [Gorgonomyces haynaldii]
MLKAIGFLGLIAGLTLYQCNWQASNPLLLRSALLSSNGGYLFYYHLFLAIFNVGIVLVEAFADRSTKVTVSGLDTQPFTITKADSSPLYAYTIWSWLCQGVYFTLLTLLSFDQFQSLGEICFIFFELSFGNAMMVTLVSNFILIPNGIKQGHEIAIMFSPRVLVFHNLNLVLMAVEILLSDAKFRWDHWPIPILFGCVYVAFQWTVATFKGFFLYFFLNYNFKHIMLSLSLLMLSMGVFFGLGVFVSHHVHLNNPLEAIGLAVFIVSVMRLRE